jgi:spoIIIJ-associated protein
MSNTGRRFFSGATLEQAVMQAARHFQIDPDDLAYRKVEKRHGFLKVRRGVVIDVDPESPRRVAAAENIVPGLPEGAAVDLVEQSVMTEDPPASAIDELSSDPVETEEVSPTPEPPGDPQEEVASKEPMPEATGEMAEAAREAVEALLEVAGLELETEVFQGDGQLEIELSGPGQQELIADRGALLLAIQHLLPRAIRGLMGRSVPCRVDSGNFHKMQEESLERLAHKVAEEVKEEQRPRSLDPMNPAERRIIHLALADDDEVVTESQGRGFFKRVSVRPTKRRPRDFDRYNR